MRKISSRLYTLRNTVSIFSSIPAGFGQSQASSGSLAPKFEVIVWLAVSNTFPEDLRATHSDKWRGQVGLKIQDLYEDFGGSQVSQTVIIDYTPQFTVGCNFLSLSEIPDSGIKVLIYASHVWWNQQTTGVVSKPMCPNRNVYFGNKTIFGPYFLENGISHTSKMA